MGTHGRSTSGRARGLGAGQRGCGYSASQADSVEVMCVNDSPSRPHPPGPWIEADQVHRCRKFGVERRRITAGQHHHQLVSVSAPAQVGEFAQTTGGQELMDESPTRRSAKVSCSTKERKSEARPASASSSTSNQPTDGSPWSPWSPWSPQAGSRARSSSARRRPKVRVARVIPAP